MTQRLVYRYHPLPLNDIQQVIACKERCYLSTPVIGMDAARREIRHASILIKANTLIAVGR